MSRASLALVVMILVAVASCGGDDGDATVTETVTEAATGAETTEDASEAPQGELTRRGIGPVEVGMSTDEVRAEFGDPDRERRVPGCELAGPDVPPILQWTWSLPGGNAVLDFDVANQQLISYRTTSGALATAEGVRVGDDFQTLRQGYGSALTDLPLGAPANERLGLWYVGNPERFWQLFDLRGGQVRNIQGGDIQICE